MTDRIKARGHIALLLTGGGARAAYQVGVLKAIASNVSRNHGIPFPILSGTSAGAINSTALACYASCFHLGVKKLEWVWKNFSTEQVYKCDTISVMSHLAKGMMRNAQAEYATFTPMSWFNNQPLRLLLNELLDLHRIDQNILSGYLKAISINASSYTSGDSVCFFQAKKEIDEWHRARRRGQKTSINVEHLMASAAIPLVFPTVGFNHGYYGDGSIHQLAPLSPPIHLGAKKIFIIGMSKPEGKIPCLPMDRVPSAGGIAGHLLDTIFNEALNSDLERLTRINDTIAMLEKGERKKVGLKPIKTLQINPSEDFNKIALKHYDSMPFAIRSLLKMVGINDKTESSIISYLLFEQSYCRELIELGYKDGMAQIDEIIDFLEINKPRKKKKHQKAKACLLKPQEQSATDADLNLGEAPLDQPSSKEDGKQDDITLNESETSPSNNPYPEIVVATAATNPQSSEIDSPTNSETIAGFSSEAAADTSSENEMSSKQMTDEQKPVNNLPAS